MPPGPCGAAGAGADHGLEVIVEADLEPAAAQSGPDFLAQRGLQLEVRHPQHHARVGAPPEYRLADRVPGEDAVAIGLDQGGDIERAAGGEQAGRRAVPAPQAWSTGGKGSPGSSQGRGGGRFMAGLQSCPCSRSNRSRRSARNAACARCRHSARAGSASGGRPRRYFAGIRLSSLRSTSSGVLPGASPVRLPRRKMWVSTAMVGSPKAALSTTLAVLRPTPGSSSSASRVRGTWPPCLFEQDAAGCSRCLALLRYRPMVLICSSRPSRPRSSIWLRRVGYGEQPARGLVDADVGGLGR